MTEVKNLNLDVIATFEDMEQEMFQIKYLTKDMLKSRESLFTHIFLMLGNKSGLVKLSLCWECSKEIVEKFKVIQESIKQNAKYYFEDGKEI